MRHPRRVSTACGVRQRGTCRRRPAASWPPTTSACGTRSWWARRSGARRVNSLAKAELFRPSGPTGRFLRWLDSIPIQRKGYDRNAFSEAAAGLTRGANLLIFPEGTRQAIGHPGPVRSGLGILVQETRAPVAPIFLRGSYGRRCGGSLDSPLEVWYGPRAPLARRWTTCSHQHGPARWSPSASASCARPPGANSRRAATTSIRPTEFEKDAGARSSCAEFAAGARPRVFRPAEPSGRPATLPCQTALSGIFARLAGPLGPVRSSVTRRQPFMTFNPASGSDEPPSVRRAIPLTARAARGALNHDDDQDDSGGGDEFRTPAAPKLSTEYDLRLHRQPGLPRRRRQVRRTVRRRDARADQPV